MTAATALPLTVLLPLVGAVVAVWQPRGGFVAWAGAAVATAAAIGMLAPVVLETKVHHALGGWAEPLGIALIADGFALGMLALIAVVMSAVGPYARAYFSATGHPAPAFWPLSLFLWAGLNALVVSADAFNTYVTLEIVSLVGVGLTALGRERALAAAFRYLIAGMLASLLYLLGIAVLYVEHGTLVLSELAALAATGESGFVAIPCIVLGLALKAALFPLHFWLPAAHANAPAPVSAVLSALVVKAAFYLLARWWLAGLTLEFTPGLMQILGVMGAAAVLWGSLQALLAPRVKLCVAYSTVAQIGYMFLLFPLALNSTVASSAWAGAVYLVMAHGLAKSAAFLVAGNVLAVHGHDRLTRLGVMLPSQPLTQVALALAGISLIGLPLSGGFIGKWLLLNAAIDSGGWAWTAVILVGSMLATAYMIRLITPCFRSDSEPGAQRLPLSMELMPLVLGAAAVALGVLFPAIAPVLDLTSHTSVPAR